MKKSKIIVPALGLLLLSTAASVSGTVAWFTASSSKTVVTSSFTVKDSGGSLDRVITAGTGTLVTGSGDSAVIGLNTNCVLTDGSFNHTSKHTWAHNPNTGANDTTHCFDKNVDSGNNWVAGTISEETFYHAVSWTVAFTYTFGTSSANVNLYFDVSSTSVMTAGSGTQSGTGYKDTEKGFRIAMYNESASKALVWADLQDADKCGYIDSDSDGSDATITSKKLTYSSGLVDKNVTESTSGYIAANSATSSGSESNCLGTFTTSAATITLKFVAWYDGTDENVISASTMAPVSATMNFFTRTVTA